MLLLQPQCIHTNIFFTFFLDTFFPLLPFSLVVKQYKQRDYDYTAFYAQSVSYEAEGRVAFGTVHFSCVLHHDHKTNSNKSKLCFTRILCQRPEHFENKVSLNFALKKMYSAKKLVACLLGNQLVIDTFVCDRVTWSFVNM